MRGFQIYLYLIKHALALCVQFMYYFLKVLHLFIPMQKRHKKRLNAAGSCSEPPVLSRSVFTESLLHAFSRNEQCPRTVLNLNSVSHCNPCRKQCIRNAYAFPFLSASASLRGKLSAEFHCAAHDEQCVRHIYRSVLINVTRKAGGCADSVRKLQFPFG